MLHLVETLALLLAKAEETDTDKNQDDKKSKDSIFIL